MKSRQPLMPRIGAVVFLLFLLVALAAPLIAPYSPYEQTAEPFERPSSAHRLGTNDMGQDLLSELIHGARVSLLIGLSAAILATTIALVLALLAGFYGGWRDRLIMRVVDMVMCFPYLPLVIVIGTFIGRGTGMQIFVITLVVWARACRELRSLILKVRQSEYVEASLSMGGSVSFVVARHILPDILPLLIPQFIRITQQAILMESSLSFLGLGDPISKSWGSILYFANSRTAFLTGAWINWVLPPGLCITLVILTLTMIGLSFSGNRGVMYHPWGSFIRPFREPGLFSNEKEGVRVKELSVSYRRGTENIHALRGVSFHIHPKSCAGIVGESGCGKSTFAMSIMGLLRFPAEVRKGAILYGRRDLLTLDDKDFASIRGCEIAYIPQNAMNALNPVRTVASQLVEAIRTHQRLSVKEAEKQGRSLLELVKIPPERGSDYSHQFSGGMRQRVIIALALVNNPSVLIADEATTGLDVLVQHGIVNLLLELKEKLGLAIFFITHDLPLIASFADHLAVIHNGELVEEGSAREICLHPKHPYTQKMIRNFPRLRGEKLWPARKPFSEEGALPQAESKSLIEIKALSKKFTSSGFFQEKRSVRALSKVSFSVYPGEALGLIGGSGSGKTTIARILMGLYSADQGEIRIKGTLLAELSRSEQKALVQQNLHYVFQDPYQSLHSIKLVEEVVGEPLLIRKKPRKEIVEKTRNALKEVNLPTDAGFLRATPSQLSGGQRQRLAFARALIAEPPLIIADEPTSMLDVTLRLELLTLMERLRERHGAAYIFITHDLALARHFCDRLIVLKEGQVVEQGRADAVAQNPEHDYTRSLIEAVREPEFLIK